MTLYDDLGVAPDADAATIKKAYRKKAQKVHPDKPDGDESAFHQITVAFEVLSDPERRKKYDTTGDTEPEQSVEQRAEAGVAQLFDQVITSGDHTKDIVSECRKHVAATRQQQIQQQKEARKSLSKLEKLSGRLKTKRNNLFQKTVEDKIKLVNEFIVTADKMLALFDAMDVVLDDYEDDVPEVQPANPWETIHYANTY